MTLPAVRRETAPPVAAVTALTRELVRTPSRGGVDDYGPIVDLLVGWMAHRLQLAPWVLTDAGKPVAVACDIAGSRPGPRYVLDACLDTAALGDEDAWTADPFGGDIEDGWLYGRGAADSKAAVALFSHLAGELARHRDFAGTLTVLFDLDEHTGGFAGIRRYLKQAPRPDGVMIGYPGTERVVTGGRGFYRARITVHGQSAHTGASTNRGVNALSRAAILTNMISNTRAWDVPSFDGFPHWPQASVTALRGGDLGSYSVVPDRAELEVDVRLTTTFTAAEAQAVLTDLCLFLDEDDAEVPATTVTPVGDSWSAYQLPDDHPLPAALLAGARSVGLDPRPGPAGPSNIGCYLASLGIPATAGFGVAYRGLHAADEAIDLSTLPQVYAAYRAAVLRLLS